MPQKITPSQMYKDFWNNLGLQLCRERKTKRLTLDKVGKGCNTSPSHLDYLEIGRCHNLALAVKLAHFYHKKIEIKLSKLE